MSESRRRAGRRPTDATLAALAFGLVVLLLALGKAVPFLTEDRPITESTPTVFSDAAATVLAVAPEQRACIDDVELDTDARFVSFATATANRVSPPITVSIVADGYRFTGRHPGGAERFAPIRVRVTPPPQDLRGAALCLRNDGRERTELVAVGPGRSSSDSATTVAGQETETDLSVTLLTDDAGSILGNAGRILDRIAAFRPVTGWMVGLLAILVLVAVPLAVALALRRAVEEDGAGGP